MAAPVANFSFSAVGLSVTFTDSSTNTPTSWDWNFGDLASGGSNISVLQSPSHTFTAYGVYVITFTATNVDGVSVKVLSIEIREEGILMGIEQMVNAKLPAGITVDPATLENYIRIEQLYLQPLLTPAIPMASVFIEADWPDLANVLVAELVSYKIIVDQVNALILALSSTSSSTTQVAQASLKKLVTGPSEAEWYNNVESTTNFLSSTFKSGSLFEKTALSVICSLASRLKINHPYCPNLRVTILPSVSYNHRR